MRIRDIVRNSFDQVIEANALPPYERRGRYTPRVLRHNPTWKPEQVELARYGAVSGSGLYADVEAWQTAVGFIRAFTAAAAARAPRNWQLPRWSGSFGEVPAEDLLHHFSAALGACNLRPVSSNTITHTTYFEATDSATVAALPEPYGRWLQVQEGRPRWKEKVELRLVAYVRTHIALRRDARFDAFADIALSGPAISLMQDLGSTLNRALPTAAASWLPRPAARLTATPLTWRA
jgi:hypothetical protein